MEFSGIVFCPMCCSNVDVLAFDGDVVELMCNSCEQVWTMLIEVERFAQHSIN